MLGRELAQGSDSLAGMRAMRSSRRKPRGLRLLSAIYGVGAAGNVAYWIGFAAGPARTDDSEEYLDFERSFPLADAYLAAISGTASVACWRADPRALPLGLMASSASIYLGCLDVLYNLRHGKYRNPGGAMGAEVVINATSLGLGAFSAWALWRSRGELLPAGG
jgi:hypothetical protein